MEREPDIVWVRRAGPTHQGDAGRDLLCERIRSAVPGESVTYDAPARSEKMLVQCKAYKKTVGKSDVRDIRDSMELHRSTAYLLVVSSQLGDSLIRFLEQLRADESIDANWWTREELEERLLRHPDVLARYSDLVTECVTFRADRP